MTHAMGWIDGFLTWQTPLSFLAGVGAHHLYAKYFRDKETNMLSEKPDGTYRFSNRFWIYSIIATVIISWIGWRTQATANQVERQAASTSQFASDTNDCLADVVRVLTTRVGFNEEIDALDKRRQDLDLRRQAVWEQLVADLSTSNNAREPLQRFETNNAAVKAEQAKIREDQAKLVKERATNVYPDCQQNLAGKP